MSTPSDRIDEQVMSILLRMRENLQTERDQLSKATARIAEIDQQLGHIDVKLTDVGHVEEVVKAP